MWDIIWVSPQGHRSVSVSRHFLLQALQCPCSVRKWFSSYDSQTTRTRVVDLLLWRWSLQLFPASHSFQPITQHTNKSRKSVSKMYAKVMFHKQQLIKILFWMCQKYVNPTLILTSASARCISANTGMQLKLFGGCWNANCSIAVTICANW